MKSYKLETATLFTPGRSSYITSTESGGFNLTLSEASKHRAKRATFAFDPDFHTIAVFAGGYPGVSQNWIPEHTPPVDQREGYLMARELKDRLHNEGWRDERIAEVVLEEGESNNSIGDVIESISQGLLDPNDFNQNDRHGIEIVAGPLHATRFKKILSVALDMNPGLIHRIPMLDVSSAAATEFQPAESAPLSIAKEMAAIAVNTMIFKGVQRGNLESLADAEARFKAHLDTIHKITSRE